MSYSLIPKNKKVKPINVGLFSWPIWLQETGAGYVVGYGRGLAAGSYVYQDRKNTGSPVSNDEYKITSGEAKMMATVFRGYISVQQFVNKEWDKRTPEEQQQMEDSNERFKSRIPVYRGKVADNRIAELDKIATFMEKSGGFIVN